MIQNIFIILITCKLKIYWHNRIVCKRTENSVLEEDTYCKGKFPLGIEGRQEWLKSTQT